MTTMLGVDKPSLDEIEHHGVKGMRWGVRRARGVGSEVRSAYSGRMLKAADNWQAVAEGHGTRGQRFRTAMSTPVYKLATGQRKSFAGKQATELRAHVDRINNGQAKVKDILTVNRNLRYSDIVKGFRNTPLHD